MAPKKAAEPSEPVESDIVKKKESAAHPPTMVMVKEALAELDSRKGASTQAIRNYLTERYPAIDSERLKYLVRKAVVKGVERGELVRPANSTVIGAQGRFRLAKRKPKGLKTTSENTDPNVDIAAEPDAKKTKTKKIKDAEKDPVPKQKAEKDPVPKQKEPKTKATSKVLPQISEDKSEGEEEPKRTQKASKATNGTKKDPVKKEKLSTKDLKSKKPPKAGSAASKVAPAKKPKAKRSTETEGTELQNKPKVQRTAKAPKEAEPKKVVKMGKKPEVEEEAASIQVAPGRRGKGVKN